MGMGLPQLLVSPIGEAKKIIDETNSGIWIPAGDPGALAEATIDLFSDKKKCKEFAKNSLNAAPLFNRERQATDMINTLESVVAGNEHVPENLR